MGCGEACRKVKVAKYLVCSTVTRLQSPFKNRFETTGSGTVSKPAVQKNVLPGRRTRLSYSILCCPPDVFVLQKPTSAGICSAADCAASERVSPTSALAACASPRRTSSTAVRAVPGRVYVSVLHRSVLYLSCLIYSSLCCTWTCLRVCAAPVCAVPVVSGLQQPVLYLSCLIYSSMCCTCRV